MRIGVDATCWQNNRGYGRHARALLSAVVRLDTTNEYTFFVDSRDLAPALPERVAVSFVASEAPAAIAASAQGRRSLADMWKMSRAISTAALDAVLFPTIYTYVPTFTNARKLVVVHDVIPETFSHLTLPRWPARLAWKAKSALGRFQADALITVSDFSRRMMVETFRENPGRIFVVGEASDPIFRRLENPSLSPRLRSLGIDTTHPLVVYVGGFSPHKNIESLVTAFRDTIRQDQFSRAQLVLVGEYRKEVFHTAYENIAAQISRLGLENSVIFPGYIPDEELVVLLNLSTVLALPSLMEGFGLPALEAAACGCPVIATKASPLPELLGAGGIFVDPTSAELTKALALVLGSENLRKRMSQAGLAAAARLSWDTAALQLIGVLRKVAEN